MLVTLQPGYMGWSEVRILARQSMRRRRWERAVLVFVVIIGFLAAFGVL